MKDGGDGRLMVTLTINSGKFLFFYVLTAFLNLNSPSKIMGQSRKSAVCPQELGIELLFPFLVNLSNTPLFLGQGNAPFYDRLMVVSRGASCWHLYLLRLNSWDVMQNV